MPCTLRYVTVIYNDEVHNYDEVIAQFKQLLKRSHSEASAYATSIDREGRMLIRAAGKAECQELTRQFLNYKPGENSSRVRFNKEPLVVSNCYYDNLLQVLPWKHISIVVIKLMS